MLKERIIKQEKFHDRVNALCRKLERMPGKLVQMAQSDMTQEYNELRFEAFKYLPAVSKRLFPRAEQAANVDILSYAYCIRNFSKTQGPT